MTRFFLIVLVVILLYWLFRRILRSFLEALRPGNEKVNQTKNSPPREIYRDVQDVDFTDISDERKPPSK